MRYDGPCCKSQPSTKDQLMQALLTFAFPVNTSPDEIIKAIQAHFAINHPIVPQGGWSDAPIATADNPATGTESPRDAAAVFAGQQVAREPAAVFAPAPLPTGATPPAPSVEYDIEGLPWDARIHSSTRTKNDDGKWKLRKGMGNSAELPRIKAELAAARAGVQSAAPSLPASHVVDAAGATAITARRAYAREKALLAMGGMIPGFDGATFERIDSGTFPQEFHASFKPWVDAYLDKRNEFYREYDKANLNAAAPGGVATLAAAHPAAPAPIAPVSPFSNFAIAVSSKLATNALTIDQLQGTLKMFNVVDATGNGSLAMLEGKPEFIEPVRNMLKTLHAIDLSA